MADGFGGLHPLNSRSKIQNREHESQLPIPLLGSLCRCAPLCLSALVPAFQAVKAVGDYPVKRGAASAPVASRLFRPSMRRALRPFRGSTGSVLAVTHF